MHEAGAGKTDIAIGGAKVLVKKHHTWVEDKRICSEWFGWKESHGGIRNLLKDYWYEFSFRGIQTKEI